MKRVGFVELETDVVCDHCGQNVLHELDSEAALYSKDGKLQLLCDECDQALEPRQLR